MSLREDPAHREWLDAECRRLLAFGTDVVHPLGGAAWLDEHGRPDPGQGIRTWITARTVHVNSLGVLLGVPGCADLAVGALAGLTGPLHDDEHGGWFTAASSEGEPDRETGKSAYDHAFVMLAASSGTVAGIHGAAELLEEAEAVFAERFWDDATGRCIDRWDASWQQADDYRGLNGT
ncbi:MAG: AGE family epimerase/isomerase, partial [Nocardioides sp.]|nr:AGE family epimerase/isomerase [Nocardioides sp.]